MNSSSEFLHGALVLGFAIIGVVGAPAALVVFFQMLAGENHRGQFRRLR